MEKRLVTFFLKFLILMCLSQMVASQSLKLSQDLYIMKNNLILLL